MTLGTCFIFPLQTHTAMGLISKHFARPSLPEQSGVPLQTSTATLPLTSALLGRQLDREAGGPTRTEISDRQHVIFCCSSMSPAPLVTAQLWLWSQQKCQTLFLRSSAGLPQVQAESGSLHPLQPPDDTHCAASASQRHLQAQKGWGSRSDCSERKDCPPMGGIIYARAVEQNVVLCQQSPGGSDPHTGHVTSLDRAHPSLGAERVSRDKLHPVLWQQKAQKQAQQAA